MSVVVRFITTWHKKKQDTATCHDTTGNHNYVCISIRNLGLFGQYYMAGHLELDYQRTNRAGPVYINDAKLVRTSGRPWTDYHTSEPWSAGPVCIWNVKFVINLLADGLAPNGARPSAGITLTDKLYTYVFSHVSAAFNCYVWFWSVGGLDEFIQNALPIRFA